MSGSSSSFIRWFLSLLVLSVLVIAMVFIYRSPELSIDSVVENPSSDFESNQTDWDKIFAAVREEVLPPEATVPGPPIRIGNRILFRFTAPEGVETVYLAGDFNGWGQNSDGAVTQPRYQMQHAGGDLYWMWAEVFREDLKYKYVLRWPNARYEWRSDPMVDRHNAEGHSLLHLPLPQVSDHDMEVSPLPPRSRSPSGVALTVQTQHIWDTPEATRVLEFDLSSEWGEAMARVSVIDLFETEIFSAQFPVLPGRNELRIPPLQQEGGFRARIRIESQGNVLASGEALLTSAHRIEDDLRYGFYATYPEPTGDYAAKTSLLADMGINAVEYYDYFPAHGRYAPTEEVYTFEPFGVEIHAGDIQRKIKAGHARNLLSLAYVAAYAASESVYNEIPDPMTDAQGRTKGFHGQVTTLEDAEKAGEKIWFWLMNVSRDSDWYTYIMAEFARTLDDTPGDLVSFDGFEVDTYGDPADTRFYAQGSARNGDLLSEVLRDFMADIQTLTRTIKPQGLLSFNSVNEFGIAEMYDVTDFLFMEIWRFYTDRLAELTEICTYHRGARNQRVVLKIYPADMDPKLSSWPPLALARVLGATMTGGGSLMVAGEPDESTGALHGLNSLYYPDHTPLQPASAAVLARYNRHDALFYGYTHGREVWNTFWQVDVPGCVTRLFAAPEHRSLTLCLLHLDGDPSWSSARPYQATLENLKLDIPLPAGIAPREVWYASPDAAQLQSPLKLSFRVENNRLHTTLPRLHVLGTLVMRY